MSSRSSSSSEFRSLLTPRVIFLASLFCLGQLFQELISEAIFTRYELPRPDHEVALVYGLFQQLGAVCVALLTARHAAASSSHHSPSAPQQKLKEEDEVEDKEALVVRFASPAPPSQRRTTQTWLALCALTMLIFASSVLPNLALQYVHYPAKVVAKSTKLVPTMLVSVLFGNSKSFSRIDYLSAALLCYGAVVFALSSAKSEQPANAAAAAEDEDEDNVGVVAAYLGLVLLGVASCADALVPNIQQYLMRTGLVRTAEELAVAVNSLGSAAILAYVVLVAQSPVDWFNIFIVEPNVLVLLGSTAVCSGVFVMAYTLLIQEAGSVVAMAVSTARKVLTLTLSYLVFPGQGKRFTSTHLLSAMCVALGMSLGYLCDYHHHHHHRTPTTPTPTPQHTPPPLPPPTTIRKSTA